MTFPLPSRARSQRAAICSGFAIALLFAWFPTTSAAQPNSASLKRQFANPPRTYASAPLWVWNDRLTESQIRQTLRDLASQDVRQAFVHPRPGLMTPYLSSEWFRLWKIALDEAAKLDMNLWIYDENSYPSGFAGGWVPETMPVSRGRGLLLTLTNTPPDWTDSMIDIFRLGQSRPTRITADVQNHAAFSDGTYLVASVLRAPNSPWHGNRSYVDLLYPGVTEQFLESTLEAYRREVGQHFGSRIPGIFTDEPHVTPAGGLPWTDDLPEMFTRRWGYNLKDHLPSLTLEVGDWRRVRHNYFQVVLQLFVERWAKPYYERCDRYGLEFTGHYWEHEWPNCTIVPDNMALAAWQHRPGIDTLMNRYQENTHAQFGNVRAVREIASVANQLGRQRTLCELYGAAGWDLRFEDMKRIADWLAVLGVNTFDEHLSYISIRGARKRDHPQSFSYHEPWWDSYHVIARYLSRISLALSHGDQVHRILVLEPTTTAWMYNAGAHAASHLDRIGDRFFQLLLSLEQHQIEYDLGCEDIIAQHGSVHDRNFRVGRRDYDIVLLPPHTENLDAPTAQLLQRFLDHGGHVLAVESNPSRIDGAISDALAQLTTHQGWRLLADADVAQELARLSPPQDLTISRAPGDSGILFHHRRTLDDGQLLFLANTSDTHPTSGNIQATAGSVERWNLLSGQTQPYPWSPAAAGLHASFQIPPSRSLLLFLAHSPRKPPVARRTQPGISLPASGPIEVRRLGPNVLTLDFVTLTAGAETLTNAYFYRAAQFAFQRNGMDRNPWDSAVQFRDEIITTTFPTNSGFTAAYHFTILDTVPANLEAVVERPDLYTVTCNGVALTPSPGRWWLDRSFGRIALAHAARPGLNELTLTARPFRVEHEVEPVYLLGSFALRPTTDGFAITPDQPLQLQSRRNQPGPELEPDSHRVGWNQQGHPFYAEGVSYRQSFNVKRKQAAYRVALGAWHGTAAKVLVNQQLAGHIFAPPYDLDVTPLIRRGSNRIEVVVIGTLKNTLGPHHNNPPLGSAWPAMFQSGPAHGPPPGNQYHTVACGLFEPFVVIETKAED